MRYKVISKENQTGLRWADQTVVAFVSRKAALGFVAAVSNCYVVDTFTGKFL